MSGFQPIEALSLSGVIDFRLTEQGIHKKECSREKARDSLHRHIPVPAIFFFATYVALMVWSNHDENIRSQLLSFICN